MSMKPLLGLVCVWIVCVILPAAALAADCDPWVARIVSREGPVDVKRFRTQDWFTADIGLNLCFGDQIRVGADARASVELNNDTILRLDARSTLVLPEPSKSGFSFVKLLEGALHLISRVKGRLEVRTPFVNAGLEGTEFVVRILDDQTIVSVIEGRVALTNRHGALRLDGGQSASASAGQAPVLRIDIKPEDATQWALYYPSTAPPPASPVADRLGEAQRLLGVGQVDEARRAIDAALEAAPGNGDALALAALIAVAQNRKDEALELADSALRTGQSANALLVMSFVQQARFDLRAALDSALRAVERYPDQGILWSRLAELQASAGDRESAMQSAQRAVTLAPQISRTQTVLGFAQLAAIDIPAAQASFEQAIQLDSADPLPRLGQGLALIRSGDLAAGRRAMEIAVSLDPDNALVRSYLGKAYAEEGRSAEAASELELAKSLDPLDPTPWLYDAFRKQTHNQPIAAVRDFDRSIALNDNRAVYRSQLLLDEDEAIRNSSIGAVYAALGLRDVARRHAVRSLALDAGNSSAHELLAESLWGVPRLGITRLSERLQAQLLQPLSAGPVAPSGFIRERDSSGGLGRFSAGPNEYTAFFADKKLKFDVAATAGGNNSKGIELVHSRLLDEASYSVGYGKYETDGFRSDADFEYETYNAFAQFAVSDRLDLQFAARHQDKDQGDLRMSPVEFSTDEDRHLDYDVFRAGARFDLDPRTTLLLSLTYADRKETAEQSQLVFSNPGILEVFSDVESIDEREAWNAEAQIRHQADRFQLIAGAANRRVDFDFDDIQTVTVRTPFGTTVSVTPPNPGSDDIRSTSAYVYANWAAAEDVIWTLGVSYDDHHDDNRGDKVDFSRVNPKLGLQWQILPQVNLRAAYLETTKHQLVVEQTIEPTQVAGFAQFFDDFNRTKSDLNAVALDLRFTDSVFGTVEYQRRNIEGVDSPYSLDERNIRAKLSALLSDDWAVSLGYERQKDETNTPLKFDVTTEAIPVSLAYRGSTGLFADLNWTYFDQELDPQGAESFTTRFDAVNAVAGYTWNKGRNRVSIGVDDLLDDVEVYLDDAYKTNDQTNVFRPFVPGRTVWASISVAIN